MATILVISIIILLILGWVILYGFAFIIDDDLMRHKIILGLIVINIIIIALWSCYISMEYKKESPNQVIKESELTNTWQRVTATVYNPVRSQCDDTPNITASGDTIDIELASGYRYIAVSRDLLKKFGMHSYVRIDGINSYYNGLWQIKDTMNSKYTNRIDFLQHRSSKGFLRHCFITAVQIQ